ncbi:MAG: ABC transporter ATP-binding protein/permease [Candidatus Izimaplasma sp.]|nr:ABC transporter ATP-binding protein/permease [Candidatus Izimaplasma bacterium]
MIDIRELEKIYHTKERDYIALQDVTLTFEPGEFIAVLGESGSGKTTFLNMISGVDTKTSGKIFFNEQDTNKWRDKKWREIRNTEIGFIFQRFNLIEHLTVIENVTLPLILTGSDNKIAKELALRLLKEVGLEDIEDKLASELSGGQRQRVAIARTIIINPTVILADEPTGALDSTTAKEILTLLQHFAPGRIIIMVTHDEDLAYDNATRVVRLHDGKVISDEIIKEKNDEKRSTTDKLLSYDTKITRRKRRHLEKQFPDLEGKLKLGETTKVPLARKYIANNPVFTRMIARENYRQKKNINRRILWSFVIGISLLLVVNIVMKNITAYNFHLFDINNNYEQYLVTDYTFEPSETTETERINSLISSLGDEENVKDVYLYYEHYVQELYLSNNTQFYASDSGEGTYNTGVYSPKLVTLGPSDVTADDFYLSDQIYVGSFPSASSDTHEVLISSEYLMSQFLGISLNRNINDASDINNVQLTSFIGKTLYVCGETVKIGDTDPNLSIVDESCFPYKIAGILNSYYKGINYVGNIYMYNEAFEAYVTYLKEDKEFTRADEYYDKYIAIIPSNVNQPLPISEWNTEYDITIENAELRQFEETKDLELMLEYMYYAIFASLFVISGTVAVNIVISSIHERIREIGIYSSIGVSKKSIRNMFVFETVETALRIFIITGLLYVMIAYGFKYAYRFIVVDLTTLEPIFGLNPVFTYETSFSISVIVGSVAFLFVSVLVPSFKAANMRAIDALRSG